MPLWAVVLRTGVLGSELEAIPSQLSPILRQLVAATVLCRSIMKVQHSYFGATLPSQGSAEERMHATLSEVEASGIRCLFLLTSPWLRVVNSGQVVAPDRKGRKRDQGIVSNTRRSTTVMSPLSVGTMAWQ